MTTLRGSELQPGDRFRLTLFIDVDDDIVTVVERKPHNVLLVMDEWGGVFPVFIDEWRFYEVPE